MVFYVCLVLHFCHSLYCVLFWIFSFKKKERNLWLKLCLRLQHFLLQKQSCISVETCQNITRPQMLLEPDDHYNCSRKLARNGNANGKWWINDKKYDTLREVVNTFENIFKKHTTLYLGIVNSSMQISTRSLMIKW